MRFLGQMTVLLAVAGCGSGNSISGRVTFRESPVESGMVRILASDNTLHEVPIEPGGVYRAEGVAVGTAVFAIAVVSSEAGEMPPASELPTADSAGGNASSATSGAAPSGVDAFMRGKHQRNAVPNMITERETTRLDLPRLGGPLDPVDPKEKKKRERRNEAPPPLPTASEDPVISRLYRIPLKYSDVKTSGLTFEIAEGANEIHLALQ